MEKLIALWKNIIALAKAINDKAQDGHLNARGATFYSEHMVFAKIQDGIDDDDSAMSEIPDMVFEIFFGGRGLEYPSSNEIVLLEGSKFGDATSSPMENGRQVQNLLEEMILQLTEIDASPDSSIGEKDLCGSLARQMQHRLYFINAYLG